MDTAAERWLWAACPKSEDGLSCHPSECLSGEPGRGEIEAVRGRRTSLRGWPGTRRRAKQPSTLKAEMMSLCDLTSHLSVTVTVANTYGMLILC